MGEAGFTLRAGAAGAGTPADDAGAKKTTTSRPAEAKSVVDYIGLAATASKLRADGETFVANVVEAANKYQGIDLKVEKIPGDNYEARILVNADQAIVLVFHDTFARRDMTRIPSISVMKDVIKSAQLKGITSSSRKSTRTTRRLLLASSTRSVLPTSTRTRVSPSVTSTRLVSCTSASTSRTSSTSRLRRPAIRSPTLTRASSCTPSSVTRTTRVTASMIPR